MRENWRYLLSEYGGLVLAALIFVIASAAYVVLFRPDAHVHSGYLSAEVLQTFDMTDEAGFRVRAIVELPDGTQAAVVSQSLARAQWLAGETCLERRTRESGRVFYRLAAPSNCGD